MDVSVDNRIDVESVGTVEVAVGNAADVIVADDHALDITVTKKEYKIVGDEVYIAKLYDDAPQWMKDLVQLVVDNTMETESVMLRNDLIGQLNQFATSYVPLNAYTQSIIDLSNADTAMHDTLETLNSNFNDGLNTANSQIIDLQSTKASKTEVATKVIETLTAQLATPTSELGAIIGNLQQTIVDGDSANADSYTSLVTTLDGLDDKVDANASAVTALRTRVSDAEGALIANSSEITRLSTGLANGIDTWATADSTVTNTLNTTITNGLATVESKWAYNSALVINGTTYNSGFGLSNSAGTGIGSEFWIDASRLKFTNSAKTGNTAPFTIDASGATPQITFNGKVSFSNVSGAPGGSGNLLYNSAPSLGNEQKGWQIGAYNTNIVPVLGSGGDPWRPSGGGSVYGVVPGAPTIGGVFDVLQTNKVPVVGGSWYDASAYTSSHRCTSCVTIAWFDSNDSYITEIGGSQVATAGGGPLINWGRTVLFAQAPANAAKASFYVRSVVKGTDPYCFVAFAYLGKSVVGQTVHGDWSEGTSASVSSTDVVNDINAGNTTTIDGGKITTGSITADKINTNSLVAENIRSTSLIQGNTIIGANIQGASIVGAVIKASYLDLDGDLEVLTDYHISTAMYNSNPAFYTDAVLISSTNEYRLPTLSTISTTTETYSAAIPTSSAVNYSTVEAYSNSAFRNKVYPSPIYGYNVSNVGSNMKFRRIRPYVTLAATDIYSASLLTGYNLQDGDMSNDTPAAAYQDMYFYIGDTLILHLYGGSRGTVGVGTIGQIYVSGSFGTTALWNGSMWNSGVTRTVTSYGLTFTISVASYTVFYTPIGGVTVTLNEVPTLTQLPFDVVNGNIRIINGDNTFLSSCTVKTPQIVCNNML